MKKLTIFSVPKAFEGHTGVIQANAIRSWQNISPEIEVFLIGDDPGVEKFALENGLIHFPSVKRNEFGTPLLNSVFEIAHAQSSAEHLMFVNCDIILTSKLNGFLDHLNKLDLQEYLAIGMRHDFDQFEEIDFDSRWESWIESKAKSEGELASILCKDYFVFRRTQYQTIPEFSIGRGNWDSWMVADAGKKRLPIIDATESIFAGHQNHDYGHVGGRMQAYLSGEEARKNIRLASGRHYVKGSMATHRMGQNGELQRTNRFPLWTLFRDSPRLVKQLFSFVLPSKDYNRNAA